MIRVSIKSFKGDISQQFDRDALSSELWQRVFVRNLRTREKTGFRDSLYWLTQTFSENLKAELGREYMQPKGPGLGNRNI